MQQERYAASVLQLMAETEQGIPADHAVCGMQISYLIISFFLAENERIGKSKKILSLFIIYCCYLHRMLSSSSHSPTLVLLHAALCSFLTSGLVISVISPIYFFCVMWYLRDLKDHAVT